MSLSIQQALPGRWRELQALAASIKEQPKPPKRSLTNTEFYDEIDALEGKKRESLTGLRHRHLEKIDRIASGQATIGQTIKNTWSRTTTGCSARCAVRRARKSPPINSGSGGWLDC